MLNAAYQSRRSVCQYMQHLFLGMLLVHNGVRLAMAAPLFTIILPTLNAAAKLPDTLASILAQDSEFELLVVDGGSTDDTTDVVKRYAPDRRVRLDARPDTGIYDAMNRAIDLSRGRFLYFIGAGDSLERNVLLDVAANLPRPGRSLVYGNVFFPDGSVYDGEFWPGKFKRRNICHQAIFYERTLFNEARFDLKYRTWSDWAFNMKCFGDSSVTKLYLAKVIARYEGGGLSMRAPDPAFVADHPQLVRRYLGRLQYAKLKATPHIEQLRRFTGNARVSRHAS